MIVVNCSKRRGDQLIVRGTLGMVQVTIGYRGEMKGMVTLSREDAIELCRRIWLGMNAGGSEIGGVSGEL